MSLSAPLCVSVQIRVEVRDASREQGRRVFRLSRSVSESGLRLVRPAPFEIGQPVVATFSLPGASAEDEPLSLRAVIALGDDDVDDSQGGSQLQFVEPRRDERHLVVRYVARRLGLPGAPSER